MLIPRFAFVGAVSFRTAGRLLQQRVDAVRRRTMMVA
jgi:hypothetical protein